MQKKQQVNRIQRRLQTPKQLREQVDYPVIKAAEYRRFETQTTGAGSEGNVDGDHTGPLSKRLLRGMVLCLCILIVAGLTACGSPAASDGKDDGPKLVEKNSGEDSESGGGFKSSSFKKAVFDKSKAEGNEEGQVDLSHVSEGYVSMQVNTDARVKLQVFKDSDQYVYDVILGRTQIFPLQSGDGSYTFKIMKNIEDNKYYELYGCSANVKLKSEFAPFVRPNQYADYTKQSKCVEVASSMAESAGSEEEFVKSVYDYICGNITYDREEAATVQSGYIPDPDEVLSTGKGICFDYASLAASMLRSQGIPTKLVFGYVAPDNVYHAWNMFYTKETGWTTVEFEVSSKDWNRVDLTFAANGADNEFIGDGSNYTDVYYY